MCDWSCCVVRMVAGSVLSPDTSGQKTTRSYEAAKQARACVSITAIEPLGKQMGADREWAYDRESHIGKLDRGLDEAKKRGWVVVDMKADWRFVFKTKP